MSPGQILGIYLHLARAGRKRQRPLIVVRMLVLSAVVAARLKLPSVAERLREEILSENPHHLIGHFETIGDALQEAEFLHLLKQLQRRYPLERAEQLLAQLEVTVEDDWNDDDVLESYALDFISRL